MQLPNDNPELAARLSGATNADDAVLDIEYQKFKLWQALQEQRKQLQELAATIEGMLHEIEKWQDELA